MEPTPSAEKGHPAADHFEPAQAIDPPNGSVSKFKRFTADMVPQNGFAFIVAPRRNGKTELCLQMLRDFHNSKRFTHTFLFSQTLSGYEDVIPPTYQFDNLSHLPDVITKCQDVAEYNQSVKDPDDYVPCSVCLILDDMVGDPSEVRQSGGIIQKLAVNGRHVMRDNPDKKSEVCLILISQRVTLISPAVRNNADLIMASRLASYTERKTLIENYLSLTSDRDGLKGARATFDLITLSKAFRFIVIATHVANRRSHADYVFYADADTSQPNVRLHGDESDWRATKKRIVF
jgi:hypothetical protein